MHAPAAARPDQAAQAGSVDIPFNSKKIPGISLGKYLQRIAHYLSLSPACWLATMVYMDRILWRKEAETGIYLSDYNIHKLLMACVVLASKFWSDNFYNDSYYAKVGGVGMKEMVRLESTALVWLDCRLIINSEKLFEEYAEMVKSCRHALIVPGLMRRAHIDPIMADLEMKSHFNEVKRDNNNNNAVVVDDENDIGGCECVKESDDGHSSILNIDSKCDIHVNMDESVDKFDISIIDGDVSANDVNGNDVNTGVNEKVDKSVDKSYYVSTCMFRTECPCGCGAIVVPPFQTLLRELKLGDSAADDRGPVTEKK